MTREKGNTFLFASLAAVCLAAPATAQDSPPQRPTLGFADRKSVV